MLPSAADLIPGAVNAPGDSVYASDARDFFDAGVRVIGFIVRVAVVDPSSGGSPAAWRCPDDLGVADASKGPDGDEDDPDAFRAWLLGTAVPFDRSAILLFTNPLEVAPGVMTFRTGTAPFVSLPFPAAPDKGEIGSRRVFLPPSVEDVGGVADRAWLILLLIAEAEPEPDSESLDREVGLFARDDAVAAMDEPAGAGALFSIPGMNLNFALRDAVPDANVLTVFKLDEVGRNGL